MSRAFLCEGWYLVSKSWWNVRHGIPLATVAVSSIINTKGIFGLLTEMYYIVVRQARESSSDVVRCKEVFYNSIMSYCGAAFYLFLFQEITLQVSVLVAAVLFIFFGLPILWCAITLPMVGFLVYSLTYLTHAFKASEVTGLKPKKQWVAEAYEPYFLSADPKTLKYIVLEEYEAEKRSLDADRMKKKIVGTVSIRDFQGPNESIWLYGLAVEPEYKRMGVGRALANAAMVWARQNNVDSVELTTTDLQTEARLLFQNLGMEMRQMYHKQLLGNALTLAIYHQGLDIVPLPKTVPAYS